MSNGARSERDGSGDRRDRGRGAARRIRLRGPVGRAFVVVLLSALLLGACGLFASPAQAAVGKGGLDDLLSRLSRGARLSAPSSDTIKKPALRSTAFTREQGTFKAAGTGSVSGVVKNSAGNPLAHVEIDVFTEDGDFLGFVSTSSTGAYQMANLPNVTVFVATYCREAGLDYVDEWYDNVTCWDHRDAEGATPLDLKSKAQWTHIDFALDPARAIAGTVKNGGGQTVQDCEVWVQSPDGSYGGSSPVDWSGNYSVRGLPAGQYYVGTSNGSGYVDEWYDNAVLPGNYDAVGAKLVDIRKADAAGIDFVLALGRSISGHVRNAAGASIDFAALTALNGAGDYIGEAVVWPDVGGAFEITGLPPGQYRIAARNEGGYIDEWYDDVPLASDPAGSTATVIDVRTANATGKDFVLALGRTISGKVTTAAGKPLADVEVYVTDTSGIEGESASTDNSGTFTIEGLFPGQYTVSTYNGQGYIDKWNDGTIVPGHFDGEGVQPVDVSSANATAVDFVLDPGFSISGKITDASTGKALLRPGVTVLVEDADGKLFAGGDGSYIDYSTSAVPAGTYYAETVDETESVPYVQEWYNDLAIPQHTIKDATPITITGANVAGIDFALTRLTRCEQSDGHIAYSPAAGWVSASGFSASGASYVRTNAAGAGATIYFHGTRLDWIAVMSATAGKADVFVDDISKGTVDISSFFADSWYGRARVFSTGVLDDGDHKVEIHYSAASAAGRYINIDAIDVNGSLKYGPPSISSLSPTSGSLGGGTVVTINGYGLAGATSVTFDGSAAVFTVNSSSKITATATAHARGTVRVTVTTPAGSTQDSAADDFRYDVVPVVPTEQTNGRLLYSPASSWTTLKSTSASGGSYNRSSASGASVVIPFKGSRLDWIATKGTSMGKADVYLDGSAKPVATINLAAAGSSYKNKVWSTGTLTNGYHTVRIVRNPGSAAGKYINVDRIDVVGSLVAGTLTEQGDSRILYGPFGAWSTLTKSSASGGSHAASNTSTPSQARVTFHFEGMRFDWIASIGPGMGTANVYLDGVKKATVDLHRTTAVYKQLAWTSGFIAPGTHTVNIVRSASGPAGKYINVDAVRVFGSLK